MNYSRYSTIIIGSGISGLFLALKLNEQKSLHDGILIITKGKILDSNSHLAQGGIVAVLPENKKDSISLHISDTIKAGCGLSDFNVAKFISQSSSHVIDDLLKFGVKFDRDKNKKLLFTLEAAHSIPRILHCNGDSTGRVIEETLAKRVIEDKNIDIYENSIVVDILKDKNNEAKGVLVYKTDTNSYEAVYSNAVVIGTGGVGQLYKNSTSKEVTTGDGIALAKRAGATIKNMEFIQFHPTALNTNKTKNKPLISEAVRGCGAKLINSKNERFMEKYDNRLELAPRDVVSRAVFEEEGDIFLDISDINLEDFKKRFPTITEICKNHGVDLEKGLIPISPACHYTMGGIEVKITGETSIKNLYAIGEVAMTKLHGANRLASNSLLECVVCAGELSNTLSFLNLDAPKKIDEAIKNTIDLYETEENTENSDVKDLISKIQSTMWEKVGIIRNEKGLHEAKMELIKIEKMFNKKNRCENKDEYELRNMIIVANIIIDSCIKRKESIGAHFRSDYKTENKINENMEKQDEKISLK